MTIASMTGFARIAGGVGAYSWAWELKSVNAKGFDARLRLPPPFEAVEADARRRLVDRLARGTLYATLSVQREALNPDIRINHELLGKLVAAVADVDLSRNLEPARLDGLLSMRGVVEIIDAAETEAAIAAARAGALEDLDKAIQALLAMRRSEGAALSFVLDARLDRIDALTQAAEANPARQADAVRARLEQTIATLCESSNLDPNRLHQEAMILAAKADIREELDRLATHLCAARDLLAAGGVVGRRLDFLSQELAREANTLCAKSNDASLTTIGLELRVEIEQFREQIQNIE
ncbi:YicC/YloC family endoribonuclease [Methylocella tundrae]|uniref:YicC domain protein n=1 Tax=Methylocella tundrae TaxID=227605 RepID=A0A4U8YWN4_METTU|nr:YicC/YloC family endoribonuclease [Methylocella tundrae]WPP05784.1 YicC/YloC family endoribonuclease [Methylocella tundrae]VFU08287.1 YicC domain protein [Methylocella tundrae]